MKRIICILLLIFLAGTWACTNQVDARVEPTKIEDITTARLRFLVNYHLEHANRNTTGSIGRTSKGTVHALLVQIYQNELAMRREVRNE